MHGYGRDFLDSIQKVKVKCALPAYYQSAGTASYEWVECKFFLPSQCEVSGGNQTSISEGAKLDYYSIYSTQADRRKQSGSSYQYWFTRSADSGVANGVMRVYTSGAMTTTIAGGAIGFVPACIIKKSS